MIIRINPIESTIEIFYKNYVHLHGFLKLYAEDHSKNKHYTIIVQILSEQTISDYIFTRQKLRNVQITDYIKAELESELQYVIQGRPILCIEKDGNTKEVKSHVTNVFFLIEDLMENKTLQPHLMKISEDQSDIHEDLKSIFPPDGLFMGNLASEKKVEVYLGGQHYRQPMIESPRRHRTRYRSGKRSGWRLMLCRA